MNILLNVDQAEALRQGINAPQSTITLDVDPAALSEIERQVLAVVILRGHDATQLGIQSEPDDLLGQHYYNPSDDPNKPYSRGFERYSDGDPTGPLVLVEPNIAGLREAIATVLAEREAKRQAAVAKRAEQVVAANAAITEALGEHGVERITVALNAAGESVDWMSSKVVTTEIEVPAIPSAKGYRSFDALTDPDLYARYQAARSAADAERDRLIKEAAEQLRAGAYQDYLTRKEAEKAEYETLYARLEGLRERHTAGYANDEEVRRAMCRLAREDAGYIAGYQGWQHSNELGTLDDAEFATLKSIQAAAPEGAEIKLLEVWDAGGYRAATEDDDPEDVDEDGEVVTPRANERHVAYIRWSVGGLPVTMALDLAAAAVNAE